MHYRGLIAFVVFILIAWLISTERRQVKIKAVIGGFGVQFLIALLVFKLKLIKEVFFGLTQMVNILQHAMQAGSVFVFGYLGGGTQPFTFTQDNPPFILALHALPFLIFMSAVTALLFHWRILQHIIRVFAVIFRKTLGVGGALGLGSAANIFFGMDASPMCIRPYLKELSTSELFAFMSVSMATVAGSVVVVYSTLLNAVIPNVIGHVLSASLISVPAAITFARIMVPDQGPPTDGILTQPFATKNTMDAITRGTLDGVQVFINVVALLLVLVGLVHLANELLALLPSLGGQVMTLQGLFGYVLSPLMWLMGIPFEQAYTAGVLMGTKTVLNELIAYIDLAQTSSAILDPRSKVIMLYALCGFANFGSVGIMIGTLGTLCPERRSEVVRMGLKAVLSGTLATMSSGTMVSFFVN